MSSVTENPPGSNQEPTGHVGPRGLLVGRPLSMVFLAALVCGFLLNFVRASEAPATAILKGGQRVTGTLVRSDTGFEFLNQDGRTRTVVGKVRSVATPQGTVDVSTRGPRLMFRLATSEVISGELLRATTDHVELKLRGGAVTKFPTAGLRSARLPARYRLIRDEDFEQAVPTNESAPADLGGRREKGRLVIPQEGAELAWKQPLRTGRLAFFVQSHDSLTLSLVPVEKASKPLQFVLPPAEDETDAPERRVLILLDGDLVRVVVDGTVIAEQPAGEAAFVKLRLATVKPAEVPIDDFIVHAFETQNAAHPPTRLSEEPTFILPGDDEFLGKSLTAQRATATLVGTEGPLGFAWTQLRGVAWPPVSLSLAPLSGEWCRIEFATPLDAADYEAESLEAVLQEVQPEQYVFQHPLLGSVTFPKTQIETLTFLGAGRRQLLEAGPIHLGDELQGGFERLTPQGSTWSKEFDATDWDVSRLVVVVETRDIETPLTELKTPSKFADDLAAGYLKTEVWLNGSRVGDLNSLLGTASPDVAKIRVPLPRSILKPGKNQLELRQRPGRDDPHLFDDCEIRNVTLVSDMVP